MPEKEIETLRGKIIRETPVCKACGAEIKGGTSKKGVRYTSEQIYEETGGLCLACAKKK